MHIFLKSRLSQKPLRLCSLNYRRLFSSNLCLKNAKAFQTAVCLCHFSPCTDEMIWMSNHTIVFPAYRKNQFTLDCRLLSSAKRADVWIAAEVYNTLSAATARGCSPVCHRLMKTDQVCQQPQRTEGTGESRKIAAEEKESLDITALKICTSFIFNVSLIGTLCCLLISPNIYLYRISGSSQVI